MKILKFLLYISILTLLFSSCDKDSDNVIPEPEPDEVVLDITNETISGEWHLSSINGLELNGDNAYFIIELNGESTRFIVTENLNSSFENILSGVYSLSENESSQFIITGVYDYSFGQTWNENYSIEYLTENVMTWKGGVSGDVFVYVR